MDTYDQKLEKILLKENYVSQEDIARAIDIAAQRKRPLTEILLAEQLLTSDLLGQALAEFYGVSYTDLNSSLPTKERVLQIPEDIAKKYRIVLFKNTPKSVTITTDAPAQKGLGAVLTQLFPQKKITLTYSLPEDIETSFTYYKKSLATRFSQIIKDKKSIAPEILAEIFSDALTFHVSDIHFEPRAEEVIVRFRIDSVLHEAGRLGKAHYENILNRIKIQSRLRIDEHAAAQDGSMRYESDTQSFDLRTSIVPTIEGEKIVLRVLASYIKGLSLESLGLSAAHQSLITESSKKPFGMILVIGPTGSGKTTTLYTILKMLNRPDVNITTIEDPVEYKIPEISQIQVNPRTNLTFAKGLRSIVRQDPDIILVGEIRDEETAEIAVNAALTGHLLLSTFHANNAATAVPRLLDMGVEPFLLASTLDIIVAQRLVRKICENCRYSTHVPRADFIKDFKELAPFFLTDDITLYKGKGCTTCSDTGYSGRTAIFEIIRITPEIQALILRRPSVQQIWEVARRDGAASLFEDGVEKIKAGITTAEELYRVAESPDTE